MSTETSDTHDLSQPSAPCSQSLSPIIDLREVTKVYGHGDTAVRAVDQVTLRIYPGELVLMLGPSGAGKTTLLSLIGGLLRPTSGSIQIAGTELTNLTPAALSQFRLHKLGFVFQFFQLLKALTARENVELVLRLGGYPLPHARQRAEELLGRFGLGNRLQHLPRMLSGGEQQRVALARALALQPPVVIADEPTGSLDSHSGMQVIQLLRQLVDEEQRTVIVASHDLRIQQVASRVFCCRDGHLEELPAL